MAQATFSQISLIVRRMDETLAFYRRLGLDIPDELVWRTDSGAHHASEMESSDVGLQFDSHALAKTYNRGFRAERGSVVIGVEVNSREAVDELWAAMIGEGAQGLQPPFDAFWGARYAILEDPDGNPVGLASPVDPARRVPPPEL